MDNLCDQVALLLRSNQELSMRLRNLEDAYSVRDGRASAIDASTAAGADSPTHSTDSPRASMSNFNGREENPAPAFTVSNDEVPHHSAFEELLHRSRVYRHAQRRHSQSSLTNDGRSTLAISICSSLTLGEVSNISVYALPLYASEISNAEAYTFGLTVAMTPPGPDDEPPDNVARPRTTDKPEQDVSTSPGKKKLRRWTSFQRRPAERLETPPRTVFGVPLVTSIRYANVGVSLQDEEGGKYIYGYVPIVVAKCGIYLKESGQFEHFPSLCHIMNDTSTKDRCRTFCGEYIPRIHCPKDPPRAQSHLRQPNAIRQRFRLDRLPRSRCRWHTLTICPHPSRTSNTSRLLRGISSTYDIKIAPRVAGGCTPAIID